MPNTSKFEQSLKQAQKEALKEIEQAGELEGLEQIRIKYLGRKGIITSLLKSLKDFPEKERPALGKPSNQIKKQVEETLLRKTKELRGGRLPRERRNNFLIIPFPEGRDGGGDCIPSRR